MTTPNKFPDTFPATAGSNAERPPAELAGHLADFAAGEVLKAISHRSHPYAGTGNVLTLADLAAQASQALSLAVLAQHVSADQPQEPWWRSELRRRGGAVR